MKGPNITSIPALEPLGTPEPLVPILLALGDDISTDEILRAGVRVLPYRSNLRAISRFCFEGCDPTYPERAKALTGGQHAIVAGRTMGRARAASTQRSRPPIWAYASSWR